MARVVALPAAHFLALALVADLHKPRFQQRQAKHSLCTWEVLVVAVLAAAHSTVVEVEVEAGVV